MASALSSCTKSRSAVAPRPRLPATAIWSLTSTDNLEPDTLISRQKRMFVDFRNSCRRRDAFGWRGRASPRRPRRPRCRGARWSSRTSNRAPGIWAASASPLPTGKNRSARPCRTSVGTARSASCSRHRGAQSSRANTNPELVRPVYRRALDGVRSQIRAALMRACSGSSPSSTAPSAANAATAAWSLQSDIGREQRLHRRRVVVGQIVIDLWGARTRSPVLTWSFRRLVRIR